MSLPPSKSASDNAIASDSSVEDENDAPLVFVEDVPAPGPFNRSRGSRGSTHSGTPRPMRRRESNTNVDAVHQHLQPSDISPAQLYTTDSGMLFHAGKLAVVLVGLPARGKTHHSVALTRYLRWLGVKSHAFHLGDYRRKLGGPNHIVPDDYFQPKSSEATQQFRKKVFDACMKDIFSFFGDGGQVAIYDAVNSSVSARAELVKLFSEKKIGLLFVECIATDDHLVARNVRDVKLSSPDFQGVDYKDAVRNYLRRIELRIPFYETMGALETDLSYIKLINGVEHIKMNHAPIGYLQNRIVFFLMNTHVKSGSYLFARAGQSDSSELTYRNDNLLSAKGHDYAQKLKSTVLEHLEEIYRVQVSRAEASIDVTASGTPAETATTTKAVPTPTAGVSGVSTPLQQQDKKQDAPLLTKDITLSEDEIAHRLAEAKKKAPALAPEDKFTTPTPTTSRIWQTPVVPEKRLLLVWSSKRLRTIETAKYFADDGYPTISRPELTQLNPGAVDGLTAKEIQDLYPEEYDVHVANPYHHRYPRAESYHDLAVRLEPLIMEMERNEGDLLIIAHESVLRVLYGYLMACTVNDIPFLKFPRNEIVQITPGAYYNTATRFPIPDVDP
ncbi:uncharacterized protein SAPINGB_P002796 [Magnusiomyces paraingens]|uniref:6-phosphofructo-2-kinase domain-containing protein n=1 Tax=Magnusiomyces paraingens TaxID=2606893 RepID=A0A5E8BIS7_9ASCO|nr:uncharacterized protein SAPINGB_P002796 [Saprochaete ingens]VVT50537.1 unnamed protein product [Saprochaete ingens]